MQRLMAVDDTRPQSHRDRQPRYLAGGRLRRAFAYHVECQAAWRERVAERRPADARRNLNSAAALRDFASWLRALPLDDERWERLRLAQRAASATHRYWPSRGAQTFLTRRGLSTSPIQVDMDRTFTQIVNLDFFYYCTADSQDAA